MLLRASLPRLAGRLVSHHRTASLDVVPMGPVTANDVQMGRMTTDELRGLGVPLAEAELRTGIPAPGIAAAPHVGVIADGPFGRTTTTD